MVRGKESAGSSPAIDGARLSGRGDVVTVTFNHRLNVLGYTHLTDDPGSEFAGAGNVGMTDIVAVLRWVRDNIAAFGGDPGNVTAFGQSGGAMKVSVLLGMPSAAGLFHKAIMQSGAMPRAIPAAEALATTRELAAGLGVDPDDPTALQRVPLADLMRAYWRIQARTGIRAFGAVVDGVVLPADPFAPAAAASSAGIPVIVGDLDTEVSLFTSQREDDLSSLTDAEVETRVAGMTTGADAARDVLDVFRSRHPEASPYELLIRILSTGTFTANAAEVVTSAAARGDAPGWRYRITWRTPVDDGLLMSPHELDVALTFGNVEAAAGLNGGGPQARRLSQLLMSAWLAFARTGDPRSELIPDWPPYDAERGAMLVLCPEPSVATDIDREERRVLREAVKEG